MALRFTERHALALVTPHLFPGEQVLHRTRGVEKPWYSRLFVNLGSFLWRYYLIVATNQRLVFIEHKGLLGGYGAKSVESFPWGGLTRCDLGWGIFTKALRVRGPGGVSRKVQLGRFWLPNNFGGAEGVASTWQASRHAFAPGAPAPAALPTPYGASA